MADFGIAEIATVVSAITGAGSAIHAANTREKPKKPGQMINPDDPNYRAGQRRKQQERLAEDTTRASTFLTNKSEGLG